MLHSFGPARSRFLDLADTSALLDNLRHVLQRCELVFVRSLSEVADLCDILERSEDRTFVLR
jgi:hypothetical protein